MKKTENEIIEKALRYIRTGNHNGSRVALGWLNNTGDRVKVFCPICFKIHVHGLPEKVYESRVPHCHMSEKYFLFVMSGPMPNVINLYQEIMRNYQKPEEIIFFHKCVT